MHGSTIAIVSVILKETRLGLLCGPAGPADWLNSTVFHKQPMYVRDACLLTYIASTELKIPPAAASCTRSATGQRPCMHCLAPGAAPPFLATVFDILPACFS